MLHTDEETHQEGTKCQGKACQLSHHGCAQDNKNGGGLEDVLIAQLGDESVQGPQQDPPARNEGYYTGDCLQPACNLQHLPRTCWAVACHKHESVQAVACHKH